MRPSIFDTLVLGAGVAGLYAARTLAEASQSVALLEAQPRIGGRILTRREGAEVIELGAEFLHGRAPELWQVLEEAGLATYERTGEFLEPGREGLEAASDEQDKSAGPLEQLKDFAGPDCSFAAWLERLHLPAEEAAEHLGYVEGFNAADAREASALALGRQQRAENEIEGDRNWRVTEGYDQLPGFLRQRFEAAGGTLVLECEIVSVTWARGSVKLTTAGGKCYHARRVVITLPLGVLQAGSVQFEPPPDVLFEAARRMRMGQVFRTTMIFDRRLWPESMSFLIARAGAPSVWWTAHPAQSLTVTAWTGGPAALPLLALSVAELRARLTQAFAEALHLDRAEVEAALRSLHTYPWHSDPYARGAYSWVPVGGLDASEILSRPVENTLFFAGEHTDTTGHWGTVHAALRSGLRAAGQVLAG